MRNEESIFAHALKMLTAAERAAYLEGACGGDQALRRHLEGLLAEHNESRGLLDRPPVGASTIGTEPILERPGSVIGRYKLLQKIGEGGFGVVYMAEQKEPVRRRAALKIIKLGMDTQDVIARFEAERQALAMMDHPNIARVFDAGATETGRPYFVMELVKGVPITRYCDENTLTTSERLELFVAVCRAIQHAHQKGIIHRDIKPSNIMVTLHDGKPVPKVIDFGVAKAINQDLTQKTLFTAYGHLIGTPQYMSPEQAEMSGLDIDTRSDVFSLGVLLYELLTGSTPLENKRLRAAGYAEMQRMIREEDPPKPSMRLSTLGEQLTIIAKHRSIEPKRLQQLIRGELDWIVMRALEKERGRRYDSPGALAADVLRYVHDQPVEACPPSAAYRLRKLARRHRGPFLAVIGLAAALLLGIFGTSIGLIRASQAEADARDDAQQAARERDNARRATVRERRARLRAEAAEVRLARQAYVADITLASRLLEDGEIGSVPPLLSRNLPGRKHDLHGFEWFYLWQQCQANVVELPHWGLVKSLAFSPDGKKLATGFGDVFTMGEIKLWDLETGSQLDSLKLLDGAPRSLAFSRDGSLLAFSQMGTIQVWDLATGKRREVISMYAHRLALSPDGSHLAVAEPTFPERHWKLNLIDLVSGKELTSFEHEKQLYRVAFSLTGRQLAAITEGQLYLWNLQDFPESAKTTGSQLGYISCFVFAPDGESLAVGTREGTIALLDPNNLEVVHRFSQHDDDVLAMAFNPQGQVVSAGYDGMVALWDLQSSEPIATDISPGRFGNAFSPDGTMLASGLIDHIVRVKRLDLTEANGSVVLHEEQQGYTQDMLVTFSPDGSTVASAITGEIALCDIALKEKSVARRVGGVRRAVGLGFSSEGRPIGAAVNGSRLELFDVETGAKIKTFAEAVPEASCIMISPEAHTVALGGFDGTLTLWDVETGRCLGTAAEHPAAIFCLAFSPDGKRVASGAMDDVIHIWDRDSCTLRGTLTGHADDIIALAFSPSDADRLASNSFDRTTKLWDLGTQSLRTTLENGGGWALAYSPDGKRLVRQTLGKLQVCDAETGDQVGSIDANGGALAFSSDGKTLAVQTRERRLQLIDTATMEDVQATLKGQQLREKLRQRETETIQIVRQAMSAWQAACSHDPRGSRITQSFAQTVDRLEGALRLLKTTRDYYQAYAPEVCATLVALLAAVEDEKQRDEDRIRELITEIERLSPQSSQLWNGVGRLFFYRAENRPAAKVAYEYALQRSPQHFTADDLNAIAWMLATDPMPQRRDAERAVRSARQAIELQPSQHYFWSTLGVALYRQGTWAEAIEALTKSHESGESDTRAIGRLFLAMSHWQLGSRDEARKWYDDAIELIESERLAGDEEVDRFRSEAAALLNPTSASTP